MEWDDIKAVIWGVLCTLIPGLILYGYAFGWFLAYRN